MYVRNVGVCVCGGGGGIGVLSKHIFVVWAHFDGLVQERRNSVANALRLRISYTNRPGAKSVFPAKIDHQR